MEFLDARRLTGPNLLWERASTVLDIRCTVSEAKALVPAWESYVRPMLDSVGWSAEAIAHHSLSAGVSLAFSAPIDALYAATTINEWAWACCEAQLGDGDMPDTGQKLEQITSEIEAEKNPGLLNLERAARGHNVSFLWDDDYVSVGLGKGSQTWASDELPKPDSLDWGRYHDVPVGIVTGTNGKTTTVRLIHRILRIAGRSAGISSTDWIAVNDRIIDHGDWSGPGGARQVLRQPGVDIAILETARGGLLRRGLGVSRADAALITNVSEDHLGDFGSQNLTELLDIKWVVSHAVESRGALILNADDPLLIEKSGAFPGTLIWFSLHHDNPLISRHVGAGGVAYVLAGNELVRMSGDSREVICTCDQIPIAMGGAARHNVANALAAAALTIQLGVSIDDVCQGLKSMSQSDNPGRANVYTINQATVLVDFAHNPAAMQSLFDMARALPAQRRLLAFGQAGDRTDEQIRELAQSAWEIGLDAVIVSELATYHRGRVYGEVYTLIRDELIRCGANEEQIRHFDEEQDSLQAALDWAQPGDLIIMLALGDRTGVLQTLDSLEIAG